MSVSEKDFSESSSAGSPRSHIESPYSSPSQQVPHLTNVFSGINVDDFNGKRPYLRILEQPQVYFRFRYRSEMVGTHGCLLGRSTTANKAKTHPTVELVNYTGRALIRVHLVQVDKDEEHPHKLLEDEQEDRDVSTLVPEQGSYKVGFAGMGIIHTAKKDVPGLLFKKFIERVKNTSAKELRAHCENIAKTINLNIVRLKFSAHDIQTDKEICPPVFSEPISNMKSAATNDLKICRISRCYGKPGGGDDVFILVEKVNRKNIMIRFFELNEHGEEVWSANGNFLQNDVHHQYAIVFRTPPYRDPKTSKNVKVFIELVRPSDGRTSEPKEFEYIADKIHKSSNKRRRVNSAYSSLDSSSGSSIKSMVEVPATIEILENNERMDAMKNISTYQINIPQVPVAQPTSNNDLIADALLYETSPQSVNANPMMQSPMFGQPNIPEPPVIQLNSTELEQLINHDPHLPSEERKRFFETDWTEYMASFGESLPDKSSSLSDFIRSSMQLATDGPARLKIPKKEPISPKSTQANEDKKPNIVDKPKSASEYKAVYTTKDGAEVKKLVKEIWDIIRNKSGYKKNFVRSKLERLFELRLSNGDTFLHMNLSTNHQNFEYIVKLIHSVQMTHLLNFTNDTQHTILHLAVINDLPRLVSFLVAKGCDPSIPDNEGNNAVHYAVICNSCLKPLLEAIKSNKVACDLNAHNHEKLTPLHLAAIYNSASSVELLLTHGSDYLSRDREGRTPLHLAIYDDYIDVTRALTKFISPEDIDALDGNGNTALQIVCGFNMRPNSVEIVKLLLDRKADPSKHSEKNEPAYKLARGKPQIEKLLFKHMPKIELMDEDEIKSEPEDDFESADEGEMVESGLCELSLYSAAVAELLDSNGSWRKLATLLKHDALLSWLAQTRSPTATLLTHVKESGDNISSKALATHLEEMGEIQAANIIRQYIE